MDGHWYGKYTGSTSGQIVVELDDRGDHFGGCAYVYDNDLSRPSTFAIVKTTDKANHIQFTAQLLPLRPSPASEGPTTASVSTSALGAGAGPSRPPERGRSRPPERACGRSP